VIRAGAADLAIELAVKPKVGSRMYNQVKCAIVVLALVLAGVPSIIAQGGGGDAVRLDPAVDAIVPANARVEKIAGSLGFVEGPVWVRSATTGYLLFSDIAANAIKKWTPDGKVSVFLEKSGFTGTDPSVAAREPTMLNGSNGIVLDKERRVVYCQHGNGAIERLEKDGKRTVLANKYEGKHLNSPNDLVYKSDGSLYFTDPPFGLAKGDADPHKEVPFNGVYRLANGKLQLLIKDLKAPNGIAFSPDEKYLYVNDTTSKTYWRYEVRPDGGIANGKVFVDMSANKEDGAPDGMKVDQKGNVYGTGPGGVWILSPEGKHLGTIKAAEVPANLAFGDDDSKALYLTARTGLYKIRLNIPGVRP
jgi:gluconolactonase